MTYTVLRNGTPVYPTWRNQVPYTNKKKALRDLRHWAKCYRNDTWALRAAKEE